MTNDEIVQIFYPMDTATENQKLIAIGIGRAIEMRVTRESAQEKVIACGFKYWRAPDAHGVVGTTKQAEDFIADLVGVEVEIKND